MTNITYTDFPGVELFSAAKKLGHGTRVVYWVGCDGESCVAYNSVGELKVFPIKDVNIVGVLDAQSFSTHGGRLTCKLSVNTPSVDLGPLNKSSRYGNDPKLKDLKRVAISGEAPETNESSSTGRRVL